MLEIIKMPLISGQENIKKSFRGEESVENNKWLILPKLVTFYFYFFFGCLFSQGQEEEKLREN